MPSDNITVIGFDFGTWWIGSAVGQSQTCTASPLQPVKVINGKPDWDKIRLMIETWRPDRLIVGLPTNMFDEESSITVKARRFSRQLNGRFNIKTELIDERLTTREAWQIVEHNAQKHLSKPQFDCIAAVLITETWLNDQA
jgi:putative Holliday junction resolvase